MWEQCLTEPTIDECHESFFYTDFLISYGSKKNAYASQKARYHGNRIFSGKNDHDDLLHRKILVKYSQSIALAPKNSKELVSAIANRSYLLRHLGKYNECIIDIDSALKYNVIDILLKVKLLSRKVFCMCALNRKEEAKELFDQAVQLSENIQKKDLSLKFKILEDLNNSITKNPIKVIEDCHLPRIEVPKNLPFLSDSVRINYNTKYGRHIVANRDLKPGEIILVDKSYCAHPEFKDLYIVCSYCLKQTWNSMPCDYCVFAMYCSDGCKNKAWEKYHDLECSVYPIMFSQRFNLRRLILSRLFLQAVKEIGINGIVENHSKKKNPADFGSTTSVLGHSDTYNFCSQLASNKAVARTQPCIKNHEKDFPIELMKIFKKSKHFVNDANFINNYNKLINVLVDLSYICSTNNCSFSVSNRDIFDMDNEKDYMQQIACALYPIDSYFNHSCHPNVYANYVEGPCAVIYTSRSVKKDEQLFVTYGPGLSDDLKDRQAFLLKKYGFNCDCIACKENWPIMSEENLINYLSEIPDKNRHKFILEERKNNLNTDILTTQPFSSWCKKKNALKDFRKLIETYDTCFPKFGAAMGAYHLKNMLWALMQLSLGPVYQIPTNCNS